MTIDQIQPKQVKISFNAPTTSREIAIIGLQTCEAPVLDTTSEADMLVFAKASRELDIDLKFSPKVMEHLKGKLDRGEDLDTDLKDVYDSQPDLDATKASAPRR